MTSLAYGFLVIALLSVVGGSALYVMAYCSTGRKSEALNEWGRHGFRMAALMTGLAALYLFYFFLKGHYELQYVYENSSRDLPTIFKFSSFWAGQEGSFLLWGVWTGVLGLILFRKAGKSESSVMPFYGLAYIFILGMVVLINPFKLAPEMHADGKGLNPLLQDYWMAIHPPTLFLGYALMAVPFAFAMGALWRRDYKDWIRPAAPWAIMGGTVLALALSMGGHWAYRTLGWGGFWGWDPVENSSFVPTLVGFALLHGLYLQRGANAAGQRMNIGLAITGFVAVMYAGYLTRSGVLTEFSNHSFGQMPHARFLVSGLIFFVVIGYGLYLGRYARIPAPRMFESLTSREFGFYLSVVVLMIAAALVTFGISTPLITGWLYPKPSTVATDFYNWTMAPVGFLLAVLLAVYPITARNGIAGKELRRRLAVPIMFGVLAVLLIEYGARRSGGLTGLHLFTAASLAFGGTMALSLNAIQLVKIMRSGGWSSLGGYLAHVGFGILLLGIVASSIYSETRRINVPMNGTASALGYRFTLPNRGDSPDDKKTVIPLGVSAVGRLARMGSRVFSVRPFMARDRSGMQMTSPGIYSHPLYDLYIAPVEFDPGSYESMPITLKPRQVYTFGPLKLFYAGLTALGDPANPDGIRADMYAIREKVHVPVEAQLDFRTQRATIIDLPGGSRVNIDPATKFDAEDSLTFDLSGPTARLSDAYAIVDVTIKPFIWLTWLGMITTVVGGLLSVVRRARDSRGISPPAAAA